jgi:hypothetical protein
VLVGCEKLEFSEMTAKNLKELHSGLAERHLALC